MTITRQLQRICHFAVLTAVAGCAQRPQPAIVALEPAEAEPAAVSGAFSRAQQPDLVVQATDTWWRDRQVQKTARHREQIAQAVARADSATTDPRFSQILTQMQAAGELEWTGRDGNVPAEYKASPTTWILTRFAGEGNFTEEQVQIWRMKNWLGSVNTTTVGATTPCVTDSDACPFATATNKYFVDRWASTQDEYSFANNLVHERIHAFGQVHVGQYARPNRCDLAYVAGNLAEALLRYRATGSASPADTSLCEALVRRMQVAGIMSGG